MRRITGGRGLRGLLRIGLAVAATATLASAGAVGLASSALSIPSIKAASSSLVLEGIPHFDHVVVLTEENENESATFGGNSPATYLNSLVPQGVFLPDYYGTGHVSLDNYLAMVSGEPNNGLSNSDCLTVSLWTCAQAATATSAVVNTPNGSATNLGDQLDSANISWSSFMDGTSTPCFHGPYATADPTPDPYQGDSTAAPAYNYADRHNPFIYFTDFIENQARCQNHQLPFSTLATELTAGTLPQFSFITPDTCHDGHDNPCADGTPGGLVSMDAWLQANIPPLLQYLDSHNGLLIINVDESLPVPPTVGICTTCAGGGLGGQVGALLLGSGLAAGRTDTTGYDHYSLLRTIEDSFGISTHLGLAALAQPMTTAFSS